MGALAKAIILGLIGAIAVPYVMRDQASLFGQWMADHTRWINVAHTTLPFSLVIFLGVTLFAFAFFAWSDR